MVFNIFFFLGIIFYILRSYKKTSKVVMINLCSIIFALILAAFLSDYIAIILANHAKFLSLETTMNVLLGSEYIYYNVIGFLLVFFILQFILNKLFNFILKDFEINFSFKFVNCFLGFFVGIVQMVAILSVVLATPFSQKYANNLSDTLSNSLGLGIVMDSVSYDFDNFAKILKENPNLESNEINIIVLEKMVNDNYTTKYKLKKVLQNSHWYDDEIETWFNEKS
ncbi:MAG: hypothetical protein ACK5NF_03675 [Bacilli bacterium]